MACGTLTKGPLGYLPIPILIIYSLMLKDIGKVWNRNLFYAGILSVGLVLAWFLPAVGMAGKTYGIQNLWRQTVGRFAGGWSHSQLFYFYFVRFPLGFLPWAIFLPWMLYDTLPLRSGEKRREVLFLFVWFAFLFVFFSLSKGKKDNYLLPLYPAAAILVGKWLATFWGRLEESGETGGRLWIPMGLVTLLFAAGWLIILFRPFKLFPQEIETYFSFAVWPLFLIVLGGVLSLAFLLWRWSRLSVFSLVAVLVIAQVYVSIAVAPRFNELRSMKPFSRKILARMGANDDLKIWKFQSTGILYYTEKPVEQIKSIGHFLQTFRSGHRVLMVVEGEDLAQLREKVDVPIYPLERTEVGHRQLLLVSNQADR
jgi:4-amino-4-deoxy-L-arabinose transferase-like glycosyltransferase